MSRKREKKDSLLNNVVKRKTYLGEKQFLSTFKLGAETYTDRCEKKVNLQQQQNMGFGYFANIFKSTEAQKALKTLL